MTLRILSHKKAVYFFFFRFATHPHLYDIMANSSFSRLYKCVFTLYNYTYLHVSIKWMLVDNLTGWWLGGNIDYELINWNSVKVTSSWAWFNLIAWLFRSKGCVHITILRAHQQKQMESLSRRFYSLYINHPSSDPKVNDRTWSVSFFTDSYAKNGSVMLFSRIAFALRRTTKRFCCRNINHKHHSCC